MEVCQEDLATFIQKDFQDLSSCYLRDCDLGDLLSEVPREKCSSLDKTREVWLAMLCVKERVAGRVEEGAELGWEKGLHHNQCYQDW